MTRRALVLFVVLLTPLAAEAGRSERLLAKAWAAERDAPLAELGKGIGVVFSPDLSVRNNCRFYEALGFACFDSPDWIEVVADIHRYNTVNTDRPIRTLILETHGTNGHGLKLQEGKKPKDDRSYVAVAALQEILEPVGVRHIVISACNSGRLLRPEIYMRLNRDPGDKLFLPATLGILDATDDFDPRRSRVVVITPASSHIETTLVGSIDELASTTRKALASAAKARGVTLPKRFAISEMLIQMLTRDPKLSLRTGAHVEDLSDEQTDPAESERMFSAFLAHLDFAAGREETSPGTRVAAAR